MLLLVALRKCGPLVEVESEDQEDYEHLAQSSWAHSLLAHGKIELGMCDICSFLFSDTQNLSVVLNSFWLFSLKSRWSVNPIDLSATCS